MLFACAAIVLGVNWLLPSPRSEPLLFEKFAAESTPLAFWEGTVLECAPAQGAPGLFKARVKIDENPRRLAMSGQIVQLLALREVKPDERVIAYEMRLHRSKLTPPESFYFISPDLPRPKDAPPKR
jgi:hypothetical protein